MIVDPSAPSPEKSPDAYTADKLQERLGFVERFKTERKITPRSELFLQLYEAAAQNALASEGQKDRLQCCNQLYRYDTFLKENRFISQKSSEAQEEIQQNMLTF
jgi:hypothetical protein